MSLNATSIIKQRESLLFPECSRESKVRSLPLTVFDPLLRSSQHPSLPMTFTSVDIMDVPLMQHVISGVFKLLHM